MRVLVPLAIVVGLFLLGLAGAAPGMPWVFGVVIPYLALALFLGGLIWRVISWANVPVPFRIPTTCGQQKSLAWIKQAKVENPHNTLGVIVRMAAEILFFRSLLRNTKSELVDGRRLIYTNDLLLWIGAMAMHWSLLIILVRHLRFFTEPVPIFVTLVQKVEGFHEKGTPVLYVTSIVFLAALLYLLGRRFVSPQLRYISLVNDYFPLFLLFGIGASGFWLRYLDKTSIAGVKELAVGLITFNPSVPEDLAPLFFGHLFLVCVLLAYFPLSKLSHMPGVFLSPTRNLANNNRVKRHVNPWDYPVKVHTYAEYEDELRDKMKAAGIPVEKE
jgi:nitrate reductase gamma subunit